MIYNTAVLFGMPGWGELILFAMVGLLIFGKRLPEVGKSLGKSIVEFKKGLSGVEDSVQGHAPSNPPVEGQSGPTAYPGAESPAKQIDQGQR